MTNYVLLYFYLFIYLLIYNVLINCSMADGVSFDVSLSLNCTDLYKSLGGA